MITLALIRRTEQRRDMITSSAVMTWNQRVDREGVQLIRSAEAMLEE